MQSRATGVRKLNETRRFVCKSDLKPLFWNGLKEMRIFEVNCMDNWYAVPASLAISAWHCGQKSGVWILVRQKWAAFEIAQRDDSMGIENRCIEEEACQPNTVIYYWKSLKFGITTYPCNDGCGLWPQSIIYIKFFFRYINCFVIYFFFYFGSFFLLVWKCSLKFISI